MTATRYTTVGACDATVVTLGGDDCRAVLTNAGARLLELHVPDRHGDRADVVLGRPDLTEALHDPNYMGATAGRCANRIRAGRFRLDGVEHVLDTNEGTNHLHGGYRGFDRRMWSTRVDPAGDAVVFSRVSPDGEEGYPGELLTRVEYRLDCTTLTIVMSATASATTVVNLVHHSYWNLAGAGTVLDQELQILGDFYTPVDDDLLPTGEIHTVTGTPFDFCAPKRIGTDIEKVTHAGAGRVTGGVAGYDHNWVLRGAGLRPVAVLHDPRSGRRLELSSDQPGVHFYAGGYLGGTTGKDGEPYQPFAGLTLETQLFPDAVNHPHFPGAVVRAGETYRHEMRLDFGVS